MLEERDGGPNGGRTLATFVPSGRYIDEVVCFQRDLAGSGLIDNQTNTQPEPVCGPPASAAAMERHDFWLHADNLFSTTSVTDASGEVVERYDYHDYGFPLILDADGQPAGVNAQGLYASKVGNPYLFTGREWDAESKLYHYRTRAYHPGLGRFMQIDRIGVWGDAAQIGNGLAGMAGNPNGWLDAFGTEVCSNATDMLDPRWHHLLPQRKDLKKLFERIPGINIHDPEWGWILPDREHVKIRDAWNDAWDMWFRELKGRKITVQMVRAQKLAMLQMFSGVLKSGFQSAHSYGQWQSAAGNAAQKRVIIKAAQNATGEVISNILKSPATKVLGPALAIVAVFGTISDVAAGTPIVKALFDNMVVDSDQLKEMAESGANAVSAWLDSGRENIIGLKVEVATPAIRQRKEDRELRELLRDGLRSE